MTYPPCGSWIVDAADLCGPCLPESEDGPTPDEIVEKWGPVATLVLWALTGRQFPGVCTDKVWPNVGGDHCGRQWLDYPDLIGGARPLLVDECSRDHGAVLLPHRPVRRVTEVMLNGETLDPSQYRLKDRAWLVRCDGTWPCWQAVCDDTFTVTYEYGATLPAGAATMAGRYACELARACTPGCECRLPSRAQTIVQEGITTAVLLGDPLAMLDAGVTGLPEVDAWVKALNPAGISRAARVLNPQAEVPSHLR